MNSTKNIVSKLKEAKKVTGMSLQDIVDETTKLGTPVSLSTVKRVFADDSRECDFRHESTLQPISRVLGLINEFNDETEDEDVNTALAMIKETYEARINDLWKHIIDLRRDRVVLAIVILLLIAFIAYLFADGLNGHWGIFQYPTT